MNMLTKPSAQMLGGSRGRASKPVSGGISTAIAHSIDRLGHPIRNAKKERNRD
ncbi:hypothetical protein HU230_0024095 [Bradyrhizobium quebecense]|uniref:hypothetical protein n=1 Tax=Bradyrhizobium quebecense TaxID=2748629 RepID=UPI001CD78D4C|nr:hypothetical protein [Bradyrhizobium quebecense]UGA41463.1 hypothetical protein HU230_0024095 [Bradyrhizobium quebecense]